jgi:hypothetical protein
MKTRLLKRIKKGLKKAENSLFLKNRDRAAGFPEHQA